MTLLFKSLFLSRNEYLPHPVFPCEDRSKCAENQHSLP